MQLEEHAQHVKKLRGIYNRQTGSKHSSLGKIKSRSRLSQANRNIFSKKDSSWVDENQHLMKKLIQISCDRVRPF